MTARILVVCTTNVCRSPMAAALLARRLTERGVDASVTSAGTGAFGLPVDPDAVEVMRAVGIDISGHRPRAVDVATLCEDGADLVVTMTRQHLRDVVVRERSAWPRTFTLQEVVRRAVAIGPAPSLGEWVGALGAGRRAADLLRDEPDDDIEDPYGTGLTRVRMVAQLLDALTRGLADLWPTGTGEGAGT